MSDREKSPFSVVVWIAQGFGIGRIRPAPGTWGSLLGIAWTALLLLPRNLPLYLLGASLGVALSIWLCGRAEQILRQHDPGPVVLDEIIALPFCFLPWVVWLTWKRDAMPSPEELVTWWKGGLCVGVFVLFRVFDITKPWPIRQIQNLPGGWGVTADDLLAAGFVAALLGLVLWMS